MKGFKLYALINGQEILLSEHTDNQKSTLTLNESLSEEENNKYSLSFDIPKNFNEFYNLPSNFTMEQYFRIGRELTLKTYSPTEKIIKLIITSISPVGSNENIMYSITAEDYASFVFSRNNVSLTLDTFEDEDFLDWLDGLDPTAERIINFILIKGGLRTRNGLNGWGFIGTSASSEILPADQPKNRKINVSLSGSNTYNGLIEVAILTDSLLLIDYTNKTFDLIGRNDETFFNKNYVLDPSFNLQELSLNYNSGSFYPILYVLGGDDDFGLSVGMIPYLKQYQYTEISALVNSTISFPYNNDFYNSLTTVDQDTKDILNAVPYMDSFLLNLDYFKNNDLLTNGQVNFILSQIYNNLRRINFDFQQAIFNKYTIEGRIGEIEGRMYNLSNELILSSDDNYAEKNANLRDVYIKEGGGLLPAQSQNQNVISSNIFANSVNFRTLLGSGYIFYLITQNDYNLLHLDIAYEDWTTGALTSNKLYYNGVDKYYASSTFTNTYPLKIEFNLDSTLREVSFTNKVDFTKVTAPGQNGWVLHGKSASEFYLISTNMVTNKNDLSNSPIADFFSLNGYPTLNLKQNVVNFVNNINFEGLFCTGSTEYYNFADSRYYVCSSDIIVPSSGDSLNINEFEQYKYYKVDWSGTKWFRWNEANTKVGVITTPGITAPSYSEVFFKFSTSSSGPFAYVNNSPTTRFVFNDLLESSTLYNTIAINTQFELFSYYNLLNIYKGLTHITEKEEKLKEDVIYYSDLKQETIEDLEAETDEYEIERLEKDIEAYDKAIGDYKWVRNYEVPVLPTITENGLASSLTPTYKLRKVINEIGFDLLLDNSSFPVNASPWGIGTLPIVLTFSNLNDDFKLYRKGMLIYSERLIGLTTITIDDSGLEAIWLVDIESPTTLIEGLILNDDENIFLFSQVEEVAGGEFVSENDELIYPENPGIYSLMYENFKQYAANYIASSPLTNTYPNNIQGEYETQRNNKENFWFNLKQTYGTYLQEGFYENDIEVIPINLYKQALEEKKKYEYPSEEYNLTYLDGSQVLGADIELISVGDMIKIRGEKLGVIDKENNILQVSAINRDLRDFSSIQLTVDKIRRNSVLVERLLAGLNRR